MAKIKADVAQPRFPALNPTVGREKAQPRSSWQFVRPTGAAAHEIGRVDKVECIRSGELGQEPAGSDSAIPTIRPVVDQTTIPGIQPNFRWRRRSQSEADQQFERRVGVTVLLRPSF